MASHTLREHTCEPGRCSCPEHGLMLWDHESYQHTCRSPGCDYADRRGRAVARSLIDMLDLALLSLPDASPADVVQGRQH